MNAFDRNWRVGDIIGYIDHAMPPEQALTRTRWYVVQTVGRAEFKAKANLERLGVEVFLPTISRTIIARVSNRRAGKEKHVQIPAFIGYLFVGVCRDGLWANICDAEGVIDFIRQNGLPAKVPTSTVENIMRAVDLGDLDDGRKQIQLRVGDVVLITEGPFRQFKGRVNRLPKSMKALAEDGDNRSVGVDLRLFGRDSSVSLPLASVQPLDTRRKWA